MAKVEKLKTLHIDVEHGLCEINGVDISKSGKYLRLEFENGIWSLIVTEDTLYTTNDLMFKG